MSQPSVTERGQLARMRDEDGKDRMEPSSRARSYERQEQLPNRKTNEEFMIVC